MAHAEPAPSAGGEFLRAIEPGRGGQPAHATHGDAPTSRAQAARVAGLSRDRTNHSKVLINTFGGTPPRKLRGRVPLKSKAAIVADQRGDVPPLVSRGRAPLETPDCPATRNAMRSASPPFPRATSRPRLGAVLGGRSDLAHLRRATQRLQCVSPSGRRVVIAPWPDARCRTMHGCDVACVRGAQRAQVLEQRVELTVQRPQGCHDPLDARQVRLLAAGHACCLRRARSGRQGAMHHAAICRNFRPCCDRMREDQRVPHRPACRRLRTARSTGPRGVGSGSPFTARSVASSCGMSRAYSARTRSAPSASSSAVAPRRHGVAAYSAVPRARSAHHWSELRRLDSCFASCCATRTSFVLGALAERPRVTADAALGAMGGRSARPTGISPERDNLGEGPASAWELVVWHPTAGVDRVGRMGRPNPSDARTRPNGNRYSRCVCEMLWPLPASCSSQTRS
jgi:hypothetical protein